MSNGESYQKQRTIAAPVRSRARAASRAESRSRALPIHCSRLKPSPDHPRGPKWGIVYYVSSSPLEANQGTRRGVPLYHCGVN